VLSKVCVTSIHPKMGMFQRKVDAVHSLIYKIGRCKSGDRLNLIAILCYDFLHGSRTATKQKFAEKAVLTKSYAIA